MTGVTGTFTHMAPEVYNATIYSEKVDIFSAAVCMVHLLSGVNAYPASAIEWNASPELVARRVALEGYRAPLENKVKNTDMRELLARMWAQDPAERPSAAQCEEELASLLAAVEAGQASCTPMALLKRTLASPARLARTFSFTPRASRGGQGSSQDEFLPRNHSLDVLATDLKSEIGNQSSSEAQSRLRRATSSPARLPLQSPSGSVKSLRL